MRLYKRKSAGGSTRVFFGSPENGAVMATFSNDHHGALALSIFERGLEATAFELIDYDEQVAILRKPMTEEERAAAGDFPIA